MNAGGEIFLLFGSLISAAVKTEAADYLRTSWLCVHFVVNVSYNKISYMILNIYFYHFRNIQYPLKVGSQPNARDAFEMNSAKKLVSIQIFYWFFSLPTTNILNAVFSHWLLSESPFMTCKKLV